MGIFGGILPIGTGREWTAPFGRLDAGARKEPVGKLPESGFAGWLKRYWHRTQLRPARLKLVERIALSPKHSLALVEADGVRLLVATSADGAPAFFRLSRATAPQAAEQGVAQSLAETPGSDAFGGSKTFPTRSLSQTSQVYPIGYRGQTGRSLARWSGLEGRVSW